MDMDKKYYIIPCTAGVIAVDHETQRRVFAENVKDALRLLYGPTRTVRESA